MSCDDAQISETDSQCVDNAECNLISGTYTCECEDGYSGDGTENCAPMSCEYTDNGSSQTLPVSTNLTKRVASGTIRVVLISIFLVTAITCVSHVHSLPIVLYSLIHNAHISGRQFFSQFQLHGSDM